MRSEMGDCDGERSAGSECGGKELGMVEMRGQSHGLKLMEC
jgi:hypothetical protein